MSDTIDNDQEEQTSSFGLGRGLDALFGDDEIMGLDDEEQDQALQGSSLDENNEGINISSLMEEVNDTSLEEETQQNIDTSATDETETTINEIEGLIETIADDDTLEEIMAAKEEEGAAASEKDLDQITSGASEAETAQEPSAEQEPERKTLEDAAESLVSALEKHIEDSDTQEKPTRGRNTLPIENLYPSPFQPRKVFREESIEELSSSIKQYGVLQPLLVRKDPANEDGYEIIAGERRWRASQKAQIHELPVVILDIDELEAYKIALIENLQREDIDPIDEANGYQKLLSDFGQTQEQLAEAVGKSRPHITNTLRLLQLPQVAQTMVSEKELSMGHARALVGVENAEEIAKKIVKQGLSVRQTEKLAAQAKGKEQQKRPRSNSPATSAPTKDADTIALENDISNALGMNVTIDSNDGKSGKLSVEFKSLDQLDELLHRLAHFPGTRLSG